MCVCVRVCVFMQTLVIGDECLRGKPYPDPYMQGLVRIGLRHVPHKVCVHM